MTEESKALVIDNGIEKALILGDLASLNSQERVNYVRAICESLGLNPLTQPFNYLTLNGKLVLYAKRDATDQLRRLHGITIRLIKTEQIADVYVVMAEATDKSGRTDSSTGAVSIKGLAGDALANALMKAETKAKRRVTLSIVGLGFLDETEIETIPNAQPAAPAQIAPAQAAPAPKAAPLGADITPLNDWYIKPESRSAFWAAAKAAGHKTQEETLAIMGVTSMRLWTGTLEEAINKLKPLAPFDESPLPYDDRPF